LVLVTENGKVLASQRGPLNPTEEMAAFCFARKERCAMREIPLYLILIFGFVSTPVYGTTHVVRPDGTGDYPTIQAAIDASVDGDIIELTDGTFTGEGNRDIDYLGKAITVRSQSGDPTTCILDCGGSDEELHRGLRFHSGEGPESVLEGVQITNGYAGDGAGVYSYNASPTLRNCLFSNNVAGVHGGGLCFSGGSPVLISCTLTNNQAYFGGGLLCVNSLGATLRNCTLSHNSANYGSGLHTWQSSVTLENTIIALGPDGKAITCEQGGDARLTCCDIYDNTDGDWVGCIADQYSINGNISEDPLFCDPENGDFTLAENSPCLPGNHPDGVDCGLIGAFGEGCGPVVGVEDSNVSLTPLFMMRAIPNPFATSAQIRYVIPTASEGSLVNLTIYDPMGCLVRTLVDAPRPAGDHTVAWDGTNQAGVSLAGGVYFYRLSVNGETQTRRMILVR
jgi:hypothetical protein